jgi:hypothetical protein
MVTSVQWTAIIAIRLMRLWTRKQRRKRMTDYIPREAAVQSLTQTLIYKALVDLATKAINSIPAADVRPVVTCADCKHNNACLTQAFVEDASRVPFDRNTFFCADGKRADDA